MNDHPLDTWHEFAAAVAYVADIERPGLTVWDALAEALHHWLDDRPAPATNRDEFRAVLVDLMDRCPEAGAPGGVMLGEILESAIAGWTTNAADRLNDGCRFPPAWTSFG